MSEKTWLRRIFDLAVEMNNVLLLDRLENDLRSGVATLEELGLTEAEFKSALRNCHREMAARLFLAARDGNDFACFVNCEQMVNASGLAPIDIETTPEEFRRVRRTCYIASARFFYDLAARRKWTDVFRRDRRRGERLRWFELAAERLREGDLTFDDIRVSQLEAVELHASLIM